MMHLSGDLEWDTAGENGKKHELIEVNMNIIGKRKKTTLKKMNIARMKGGRTFDFNNGKKKHLPVSVPVDV